MREMRMRVDASELEALREDFANIQGELMPAVEKVTKRGAMNIKKGWARRWEGHPAIKHMPRAINYDITVEPSAVEAEIGADHSRSQGVLAHLIEFGTLHSAPIPGGQPALDEEDPRYVEALAKAAEKVVRGVKKRHGR
jgi:hypothetical protein